MVETGNTTGNTTGELTALASVVGVFDSPADACRAAVNLRGPNLKVQGVSQTIPVVPNGTPEIAFYEVGEEEMRDKFINGMLTGGAIGAGSGLLLVGIPVLNLAAPVVGAMVGAWIGAIAGIDEATRVNEVPREIDYHRMLAEGKSFVVITGDEAELLVYGEKMVALGASDVHQHSPFQHVYWK